MASNLSKNSPYETLFGVRYRGPGRPGTETMFPADGAPRLIADVARRRAYAVVHEESKDRLSEVFRRELAVLKRRGEARVAEDIGKRLSGSATEVEGR